MKAVCEFCHSLNHWRTHFKFKYIKIYTYKTTISLSYSRFVCTLAILKGQKALKVRDFNSAEYLENPAGGEKNVLEWKLVIGKKNWGTREGPGKGK